MRNINWNEVTTPNAALPAGGYVIEILDVVDNEEWEQLEIIYNIVDGPYKDIYKNLGPDDDWKHKFSQKYTERALGFFKLFLEEIEHDNPGFDMNAWGNDPLKLVGKKLGILLGEYRYIYEGKAKYRLQSVKPLSIQDAKSGNFEIPEPTYKRGIDKDEWIELREGSAPGTSTASDSPSVYDDDIPFI